MFKLNEVVKVKGVKITKCYDTEWYSLSRFVILEPFVYVSSEEDDELGADEEAFLIDFLGVDIPNNFENQEPIIKAKLEESKKNIKEIRMTYSIKKLKSVLNGEKIKIARNHIIEIFTDEVLFYKDKNGEIDVDYKGIESKDYNC